MISFSDTFLDRLLSAERVAVLTGAGMSAESGVPTFRDPGGLWQKFKPEELANMDAFLRNPSLVQGWYAHRREIVEKVVPNPGHLALAELEERITTRGGSFSLITQNVDNLHQRAGSRNVTELHGNLTRNYCVGCSRDATEKDLAALTNGGELRCIECNDLIRPNVVWFGEMLPMNAIEYATTASQDADVFLSIGTSAVVYPAAGLPLIARQCGAFVAEINIEPSAIASNMSEVILGPVGKTLPQLIEALNSTSTGRSFL